ncbi:MAG: hypothetical protein RL217_1034 [Pseudomonadota bacterium]|jgi:predicted AAA+ superfamily ATPase
MRNVLISQNGHWQKPYQNLYSRKVFELLLENVSVRHIQVLQGIRRSGKSSLFKLLINQLLHSVDAGSILYVNLDDPFFIQYANNPAGLYEIIQTAETLTQKKIQYLFLDEVQAISGWEKYVKSMYDSELFKKIFITGSNSSLLSGEFATLLTGRYLSRQIYPLSFNEILRINDIDTFMRLNEELPKVLKIVDDMMTYGSFVEVYNAPDAIKREIISSYYEAIFFKDCVANTGIRDIKGFKELSFYLTSNIVTLFSYSSLARVVKLSDVSVKDYIYALGSSYLFSELNQFSYSLKEQASTKKKLYLTDNSFMKLSFCFSNNYGKLLENLVFSELQKRGDEIFFYNKENECDFIIKNEGKLIAIQVCYELNEHNQAREVNGLLKLPFEVHERVILTYNQSMSLGEVSVVPFWEYFF